MNYSRLSQDILKIADEIMLQSGEEYLSARVVVMAIAQLCNSPYMGITKYDDRPYPEYYEEERLRYIFKKLFKGTPNIISHLLKKRGSVNIDNEFSQKLNTACEITATNRGKKEIAAEYILLNTVLLLPYDQRVGVNAQYSGDFSISEILADVDENIYDFVIRSAKKVMLDLEKKLADVTAKRDWKPAEKFAEPQELLDQICQFIKTEYSKKELTVTVPCFFGAENADLILSIGYYNGVYSVHDNGSALKVLKKNTEKFSIVFNRVKNNLSLDGENIVCNFCQWHTFLHYLQILIFVSHADLYYENLREEGLKCDNDRTFEYGEEIPKDLFSRWQEDALYCKYHPDCGVMLGIYTTYSRNSTTVSFRFEKTENGVKISDNRIGKTEGEIFESFYWNNNNISQYSEFINRFCKRFGCVFDGENISLTFKYENSFVADFLSFLNLAVLLSELGDMIELPKAGDCNG